MKSSPTQFPGEEQLIAKYEALGWKLLRWKDRRGNDCSGWRSPDGKQCAVPPVELQDFYRAREHRINAAGDQM